MKNIFLSLVISISINLVFSCQPDWYNKCTSGGDCCSRNCDKDPSWEFGVCKPGTTEPPKVENCQEDWSNQCVNNEHCCSRSCDRSPAHQYGICRPKPTEAPTFDKCGEDWSNQCIENQHCCSGICDRNPEHKFGICKPKPTEAPTFDKCVEDWSNQCIENQHCCSGICDRNPEHEFGICKPKPTEAPTFDKCVEDWSNQCIENQHCCSGICDRNPEHKFGICKPKPTEAPTFDKCGEDWSNQCIENQHCCSGICDRNPEHKFGICKPKPTEAPTFDKCGEDWSNQCIENQHCCSGLCERNPDHKYGICKPKPVEPEEKCEEDWVGDCSENAQCCSGLCRKEREQNSGFCRPKNGKDCEDDWFNECVASQQCCSGFCDKPPSWKYGICKQRSNPSTGNDGCIDLHEIGCKNNPCCNDLTCSSGPYGNWIQGMCIDEADVPPPKETLDEIDEEEEDFAYYKQFVQDKLFLKNDETFESEPLKCRDIDIQGQYFYKYNDTHSFRICDVCKEFPFQKLKDVRISNPAIKIIPDTTFQECFTSCTDEENCVAVSFDEDANVCHMFDSIDGNYSDDEYGWATVILTQPIFILRDYALSRHTQLVCEAESNHQYETDDVLDCFSRCEKHNCYASSYHENKCDIYLEEKGCKNIYYKFGHYSLFYRDYFHDTDEWRFSEIVKDGSDEELDDIITREELQGSAEGSTGPRVPQSSNLTIYETQKLRRENFLNSCYKNCLQAEICTGVLVNYNELICQIMDWNDVKSRNYDEKGFREYKLIHKKREKILYGYDENTYFKLDRITYNEELKTQNLKECINKCDQFNHCNDIYFNLIEKTCLIVGEFPKRSRNIDPNKWINFKNTNRITFNHAQFRFAIIGKNQYLSRNFDKYLLDTIRLDERPAEPESATEKCFKKCNDRSDDCQFVQILRSENFIECKIYKDVDDDEEWKYDDRINSDLYERQMVAKFNKTYLNQLDIFNEFDAMNCKPDADSISQDAYYLYKDHDLDKINELARTKRNLGKKIGNFFKGIGKAIIDIPKKIVETGIKVVKSIDKAVKGDKKGALKEFREAPLVKSAEKLYHDAKTVGEGIVQGDIKKIGKGALGVVTSDFVDFIPGPGKIISTAGKGLKGAIKGGKEAVKGKGKRDVKNGKGDIGKKNNQKSDEKKKKDKEEKEKKCSANNRNKRATAGQKRKRDDCKDKNCAKPEVPKGSRGKLLPKTLNKCNNVKPKGNCNYLCNAGYTENPYKLTCQNDGKWDKSTGCTPQDCGKGRMRLIFISSAASHYASGKGDDALLFAVLLDTDKRSPFWSITYHKWQITNVKADSRPDHFLQHPCPTIKDKQLTNAHFEKKNNPKGYQRGHLSPADLYRWNEKSTNSGNLYINIAPQGGKFNMGSWKTLETSVQCASKNKIKAIVVTGHGGKNIDQIGSPRSRVEVKEFFWKLVCYKFQGKTHVAAFRGSNYAVQTESQAAKKETLTPRDQQDIINISPELSNPASNPWAAAVQMLAKDKFNLINRYPLPQDCQSAKKLDNDQKKYWKDQFKVFNNKRKKRETGNGPFCSESELKGFADWLGTFSQDDEKLNDEANNAGDDDEDDGDDGGEIKNIPARSCGKKVVGYYASWGKNVVKKSTLSRFTHIVYAFFEVESNGRVRLGNPDHSTSSAHDEVRRTSEKRLNHLLNLRDKIDGLKIMFAVGGWENSQYFSKIAASSDMKTTFIASVLKVLDDYSLDGVDIDWEYPVAGGAVTGVSEDKQNYVKLMSDLRFALDEKAKQKGREKYLLTFAGAAGETALRVGYDLPGLLKYADWVNVMSYDFFGPWESKWGAYTGPPAPLYHNAPKGYSGKYNVNWAIKTYVCKLQSPKQVVMGVPLYGRYWHNVEDKSGEYAIYRMATAANGKFEGGFVSWKDIKKDWLNNPKYKHTFDQKVKSPYAYGGGTYLGYENPESVREKIKFALEKNLGGLMAWEIGQDDDENSMIDLLSGAALCTNNDNVNFKCTPIDERRWWTYEENQDMAGLCGKSAPLYKGYYPLCDPDDLGYSCCGSFGYCGSGSEFCDCPTCVDYTKYPEKILEEPIKPKTGKVLWHLSNAPDGSRGRCGKDVPKVGDSYAICNPDDPNAHCCSNGGYCGSTPEHCNCKDCIDFKKNPDYKF